MQEEAMPIGGPSIFVWRGQRRVEHKLRSVGSLDTTKFPEEALGRFYQNVAERCPFCSTVPIGESVGGGIQKNYSGYKYRCGVCGFHILQEWFYVLDWDGPVGGTVTAAVLKELPLGDAAVSMNELGSHLKRKFSDVYALPPRRFEELVADLFRNQGYSVRLTQKSHDGGVDIYLLERSTGDQLIVQCKRWAETRKVTVQAVRELVGVLVAQDLRRARLVTTSHFTRVAEKEAGFYTSARGFEVGLLDCDRLLRELGAYNTALPTELQAQRLFGEEWRSPEEQARRVWPIAWPPADDRSTDSLDEEDW